MKNKNFQKSKRLKSFDDDREARIKKVGATPKKKKNFKKEIYQEYEEEEEFDLFGRDEVSSDDESD